MHKNWHISSDQNQLSNDFAKWFMDFINNYPAPLVHVALSGGSTPIKVYDVLTNKNKPFRDSLSWSKIHFYWGDERCVPPTDLESNYGMARKHLFDPLDKPEIEINRMKGENIPEQEANDYALLLKQKIRIQNNLPQFDLIILGIGDDGHTASIFPDSMPLLTSNKICEVATHPISKQKRITLTGKVLNNSKTLAFLVSGQSKRPIITNILNKTNEANAYPSAHINQVEDTHWFLDHAANQKH